MNDVETGAIEIERQIGEEAFFTMLDEMNANDEGVVLRWLGCTELQAAFGRPKGMN